MSSCYKREMAHKFDPSICLKCIFPAIKSTVKSRCRYLFVVSIIVNHVANLKTYKYQTPKKKTNSD